jgi:ADP-heptose:LPS heptosyltransferase
VKAIRIGFPNCTISILASQTNAPVAEISKLFDKIYVKRKGLLPSILQLLKIRKKFDVVVDLNHAVAPHAILNTLVLAPKHVASPYKDGRWGVKGTDLKFFDIMPGRHQTHPYRPMAEIYLDIARLLDCPTDTCLPYPLPKRYTKTTQQKIMILLNHEGSGSSKRLKNDDLIRIAELVLQIDPSIDILMTPLAHSYSFLCRLLGQYNNVKIKEPQPDINQMLEAASAANLIITPDTSLVHIASAYNKPLIAVYAENNEFWEHWRPLNLAPTRVIFSKDPKTLSGYSSDSLLASVEEMVKNLQPSATQTFFMPD